MAGNSHGGDVVLSWVGLVDVCDQHTGLPYRTVTNDYTLHLFQEDSGHVCS